MIRDGKTWVVDAKTGKETIQEAPVPTSSPKPSVYQKSNDLFIKIGNDEIQLTSDKDKEINPTMSPDGNYVAFTKNNDLYSVNILSKKETKLTNDGSDVILNGYASWVYMEEILGRKSLNRAFWWSPDSKKIAFFRSDDTNVPLYTITDANGQHGYLETVRYPKVGDKNPEVKVGIVMPDGGKITWSDFDDKDDQYFGLPYWLPDGSGLLVQWMNRKQNILKIWNVNPANGSKSPFYTEQQKTWIDLDDDGERITFLKNGNGFVLLNDASGWKHMYHYDMKGNLLNPVTHGKFSVTGIKHIDEKKKMVYFTARQENSARQDLYKIGLDGKKGKRLTFGDYSHTTINLSPDASYFITSYSNAGTPGKMALLDNNGKIIKELADSKGTEFNNHEIAKTELLRVKSDDQLYDLPMKVTWPLKMDRNKKYPVLISIYGGPNATGVMDTWTLVGTQQWYAKEGLIQVTMDHRASGHFGKEGVNNLYHNLGYWETKDYSTMVKWLITNGNADPTKIGITGFSYGGYMSAYALTYGADVFTHGMAGGSVVDWSLYDTHYTERFMGTTTDNPEGYKSSSVLTHTDKYKGMLQIVHGVIDENVHMQNSIQLISNLQEKKKDFEFMIYSGGRHGWGGNKQAHFQNLKTKFIYKYLLEKITPIEMIR
jgi:dipeptidyl-peptidase-4